MSRKLIAIGLCYFAVALAFFIAYAKHPSTSLFSNDEKERMGTEQSAATRTEAEIIVLRSEGFHPRELTRPPGRFLLALQNQSSEEELSLLLTQESGPPVRQIRFAKGQSKLRDFIQLPPGRYVLAETNHPEWTCSIVITAH